MNYQIIYDKPGRLRIRCGANAFNAEQGYGISSLLRFIFGVKEVFSTQSNGGILVTYSGDHREEILFTLFSLDKQNLPVAQRHERETTREIDESFQNSLLKLVFKKAVRRFLLPTPIRWVLALHQAAGYLKKGFYSIASARLDVEVLDAASITAAVFLGDLNTASSIMFLLNISGLLADYTHKRAHNALFQSLAVNIDCVWLVTENAETSLPLTDLNVGDTIRVRTGSMIPVDGEVSEGEAAVNEASMTGEPMARIKQTGMSVYAGTVVEEGSILIRVKTLTSDSRICKIIEMIERSEELKATVQSKAEHLADSIVPYSFLISGITLLLTRNVTKALSVLMVDYSCAIKLATPISVISAMREAAAHKILVKGGKFLESYALADTIVFDKTGTLTKAVPTVSKILTFNNHTREEILRVAACLEEHFPHSVAKAIVKQAETEQLRHPEDHAEVEYIVAHGIVSKLHDKRVLVGSAHFVFEDEGILLPKEYAAIIEKEIMHQSPIYVVMGGNLIGVICIDDPPREEANKVIEQLKELGFSTIVMLTGDGENSAKSVCESLGIEHCYSQVLPEDKHQIVSQLKSEGHCVVMVGDGINDSPALACADVSISMKNSSDIAREVSDVTLLSNQLDELLSLRVLSISLLKRIHHNYRFILSFNSALLLLGISGTISPATSAWMHNVSTMLIAGLSMRPQLKK